jgi:hypothetical protein
MPKLFYGIMIGLLITTLLLSGCKKEDQNPEDQLIDEGSDIEIGIEDEKDVKLGAIEDEHYLNTFFEFDFKVPTEWVQLTQNQMSLLMSTGQSIAQDQDLEVNYDEASNLTLFGFFKYPLDAQKPLNPNIVGSAELLDPSSGITTGEAYLQETRALMKTMTLPIVFDEGTTEVSLLGHSFTKLNGTITIDTVVIQQVYYTSIINGYAVNIIATYSEEDGKDDMEAFFQ